MIAPNSSNNSSEFYTRKKFLWTIYIFGSILLTLITIIVAVMFGPAGPFGPTSTSFLMNLNPLLLKFLSGISVFRGYLWELWLEWL
jgi:hypothetical protein